MKYTLLVAILHVTCLASVSCMPMTGSGAFYRAHAMNQCLSRCTGSVLSNCPVHMSAALPVQCPAIYHVRTLLHSAAAEQAQQPRVTCNAAMTSWAQALFPVTIVSQAVAYRIFENDAFEVTRLKGHAWLNDVVVRNPDRQCFGVPHVQRLITRPHEPVCWTTLYQVHFHIAFPIKTPFKGLPG